jgi:hypothetical protein
MKIKDIIDKDIVKIEVPYFDFDNKNKTGFIEIHKKVEDEVELIFKELEKLKFPIFSIKTIDNFNFSDEDSVKANNTSAYNFRFVAGTKKLSDHAIGLAIDINPFQNPWLTLSIVKDPTHLFIAFLIGIINIIYGMGWQNNITKYLNKKKDVR